jgi:phosphatidylserine decarboxylase
MSILKEGFPFIFPALIAGAALAVASRFLQDNAAVIACIATGSLLIVFALFCMFFFRDPKITVTQGEGLILSPCNGTVMETVEENGEKVIRVFLSIFSVHLQRSPVSGTVTDIKHQDGKFLAAWDPRAHVENEQNIFIIKAEDGSSAASSVYTVRQIAGLIARRCVSWVSPGAVLKAGDKIGMIKFSSQVDLHMPSTAQIKVKPGDKTRAGITILAQK